MSLKEKLYEELREWKFECGRVWKPQDSIRFINTKLDPLEKREFESLMNDLCRDGFFTGEPHGSNPSLFRLTEKGEKELWG